MKKRGLCVLLTAMLVIACGWSAEAVASQADHEDIMLEHNEMAANAVECDADFVNETVGETSKSIAETIASVCNGKRHEVDGYASVTLQTVDKCMGGYK